MSRLYAVLAIALFALPAAAADAPGWTPNDMIRLKRFGSVVPSPEVEVAGIAAERVPAAAKRPSAERAVEVSDESHLVSAEYWAERAGVGGALRWPETHHVPPL